MFSLSYIYFANFILSVSRLHPEAMALGFASVPFRRMAQPGRPVPPSFGFEFVARVALAVISSQRDLRLLHSASAYVDAGASALECALTQKRGRGSAYLAVQLLRFRQPRAQMP